MTDDQIQRAFSALDLVPEHDGVAVTYSHSVLVKTETIAVHVRPDDAVGVLTGSVGRAWVDIHHHLEVAGMKRAPNSIHDGSALFTRRWVMA